MEHLCLEGDAVRKLHTAAPEFDGIGSGPDEPHSSRFAWSVMLLARLVGVLAVVFAVVAVIVLHSAGSQRLVGHITSTRTIGRTPSAKQTLPHTDPSRHPRPVR